MLKTLGIALLSSLSVLSLAETGRYQPWNRETSSQRFADEAARHIELQGGKAGRVKISGDRAMLGNPDAPLQVVVFSDFQCQFCRNGYMTLKGLQKKHGDKLVMIYRSLPLPIHNLALPAARRFEAIALISPAKAYLFHDYLFENQKEIFNKGEAGLDEAVKHAGISGAELQAKLKDPRISSRLKSDAEAAKELKLTGTPSFLVNGVVVRGAKAPAFFDELIAQLQNPKNDSKSDPKTTTDSAPAEASK